MIIEKLELKGTRDILLIHFDPTKDHKSDVKAVSDWLKMASGYSIAAIVNGQPCPTNPLPKVTLFNSDNEVLLAIVKEIVDAKPGGMIPLSKEEMKVFAEAQQNGDMVAI